MFADPLVRRLQLYHGSAKSSEVGRTQRVVVVVEVLTVHPTPSTKQSTTD